MEKFLTEYLIKVDNLSLTEKQKKLVNNLFYSASDIERIERAMQKTLQSRRSTWWSISSCSPRPVLMI